MLTSKLVPRYSFKAYSDITPGFLNAIGVRFLMIDLDNTIARYSEQHPAESVIKWVADMNKNGIDLFIVSNSKRAHRVDEFSEVLGIGFTKSASKPSPKGLLFALENTSNSSGESALLGDQVFTDVLAANRAGVTSIIVRPLSLKNPLLFLRFLVEAPFRAIGALRVRA